MAIAAIPAAVNMPHVHDGRCGYEYTRRVRGPVASNPIIAFTNGHLRPGDSLFIYPSALTYYFLARTANPTRVSCLLYGHHTPEEMREALIARKGPNEVRDLGHGVRARNRTICTVRYGPPPEAERIIEPYLAGHYLEMGSERGIPFLERSRP